jgi:hypothetical protein
LAQSGGKLPSDFKSANGTNADVRENDHQMARAYLIFSDIEGKRCASSARDAVARAIRASAS